MAETFVARVSLTINAPRAKVWEALVDPQKVKQYILASDVVSQWREGSSIVWTSEFNGKPFEIRGTILRLEPQRLLEFDQSRPIFRASQVVRESDHHRVTIELQLALGNMKALLEGTSVVPMR